jgi:hypothetical protein
MITSMGRLKKITVEVDETLLASAQKQARDGVTGTVRRGLEILAAARSYERLAALRGKVKFDRDLATMRNDRR